MNHDDQLQSLYNEIKRIEELRHEDNMFYQVALNISGIRKECEERALKIITRNGYLKALKISRDTASK